MLNQRKDINLIRRKSDIFNEMWGLNYQRKSGKQILGIIQVLNIDFYLVFA